MAFITINGENKIAFQQGNDLPLNITHFVLANVSGLGAEPEDRAEIMPNPADIVDVRPVTRKGYVNENQVVYSLTLDSTIGDYEFNWIGLKDADDVLIAVIYLADPITKRATAGGIDGNNIVRNFLLQYSGIQATTAINAPAETWQIDFTLRLLQIDERERLSNLDIYGNAAFVNGFNVARISGNNFSVSAGVGYVGGIRCQLASLHNVTVSLPTKLWVIAALEGDLTGRNAVFEIVANNGTLTNHIDSLGVSRYVAQIASITAGGVITDVRQPYKLGYATETSAGIIELATPSEALVAADSQRAMTPATSAALWDHKFKGSSLGAANLNDTVIPGNYYQGSVSGGTLARNYPIAGFAGFIGVEYMATNGPSVMQTAKLYNQPRLFQRALDLPSGWTEWVEIWTGFNFNPTSKLGVNDTAINAAKLGGEPPAFFRNASTLNDGTVPVARLPIAAATEALLGTANHVMMTPLRTMQAFNSRWTPASTSAAGIVQLNNTVTSGSTSQAATANAVRVASTMGSNRVRAIAGRAFATTYTAATDGLLVTNARKTAGHNGGADVLLDGVMRCRIRCASESLNDVGSASIFVPQGSTYRVNSYNGGADNGTYWQALS